MHLIYFDETKFSPAQPYFMIGGILVKDERLSQLENTLMQIHDNQIPIRVVCINTVAHRAKYAYPQPEYNLGLMLILERFCEYLDLQDDIGLVFGDYEKDEITKSILDFSQFKQSGSTPMHFGRPLGRLKDTIYFTQSHHSRFLQVADMIMYMAQRYENDHIVNTWHDTKVKEVWEKIKTSVDYKIKRWP